MTTKYYVLHVMGISIQQKYAQITTRKIDSGLTTIKVQPIKGSRADIKGESLYLPNPSARAGYDTRSIFKAEFNRFEFRFFLLLD